MNLRKSAKETNGIPELFDESISVGNDIPEDPVYELMRINEDHGYQVTRLKLLVSAYFDIKLCFLNIIRNIWIVFYIICVIHRDIASITK